MAGITSSRDHFRHDPLPTASSIRLLKFLKSSSSGEVRVELSVHDLNSPPTFNALSYVCGEPYAQPDSAPDQKNVQEPCERIVCNARPLLVVPNLKHALEVLCKGHYGWASTLSKAGFRAKLFWIDAICIDQENPHEKASQVRLMGKIYQKAYTALTWLGPSTKDSADAVWAMRKFMPAMLTVAESYGKEMLDKDQLMSLELYRVLALGDTALGDMNTVQHRLIGALRYLRSCRYFQRAWIMQELTQSQRVTLLLGPETVSLDQFLEFVTRAIRHWWITFLDELAGFEDEQRVEKLTRIVEIFGIRQRLKGEASATEAVLLFSSQPQLDATHRMFATLLHMLWQTSKAQCTDPRDRIFSVLSLCDVGGEGHLYRSVEPNYVVSAEELYTTVMTASMTQLHSLDALALATRVADKRDGAMTYPSWVPDFTKLRGGSLLCSLGLTTSAPLPGSKTRVAHCIYDASLSASEGGRDVHFSFSKDRLRCAGARIFNLAQGTHLRPAGSMNGVFGMMQVLKPVFDLILNNNFVKPSARLLESVARTLIANKPLPAVAGGVLRAFHTTIALQAAANLHEAQKADDQPRLDKEQAYWRETFQILNDLGHPKLRWDMDVVAAFAAESIGQLHADTEPTSVGRPDGKAVDEVRKLFPVARAYIGAFALASFGRKLFVSPTGRLVLGPEVAEANDELWVLHDAKVLHVLRPCGAEKSAERPQGQVRSYRYVGEAYTDGCMTGELVAGSRSMKDSFGDIEIV